jgi:hypothetical protein
MHVACFIYHLGFNKLNLRSINWHIYNVEFLCVHPPSPYTKVFVHFLRFFVHPYVFRNSSLRSVFGES